MKTVIRKGVFETNSSSMHSITISDKKGVMNTLSTSSDGMTVNIDCDYTFGWGVEEYNDAEAKAAYCVLDNVDSELIEQAIKSQTGASVLHFIDESNGYIDHQSVGTAKSDLTTVKEVQNFIFNPNCILEIDNDNH